MNVSQLRCPTCLAPVTPAQDSTVRCGFCGASLVVDGASAQIAAPSRGLMLDDAGANKIAVIKVVREQLGLSLKAAMQLVESAPVMLADLPAGQKRAAFVDALIKAGARAR